MFSPLRNRFGIPGVISVIALVFAMMGGAYAATNGNPLAGASKAKKGPPGPRGKTGPAGPVGPAGAAGPAGAKGDTGAAGANGKDGTNGTNGVSAEATSFAGSKGTCTEGQGGLEVKSAKPAAFVCNGKQGEPWTAGGTLPSGKTETGAWSVVGDLAGGGQVVSAPISFTLPLSSALDEAHAKYIKFGASAAEKEPGCTGGTAAEPKAEKGYLCVYAGYEFAGGPLTIQTLTSSSGGASKTGAVAYSEAYGSNAHVRGSWAVTAP